jgi:hypothetical protein
MEPQSILSEKGKKLLVVNNYKFGKAKSQAADYLCQPWYRKIQSLGLVSDYKNKNSNVDAFWRLFFGMHFLEPVEIGDFFFDELYSQIPVDNRVTQFCYYSSHSDIFAFLDILLNFQAETYVKINSAQRGVKKLRCNTKKKQEFIKTTIIELYKSGNLSRLHFVKKLSFYYFLRITGLIS